MQAVVLAAGSGTRLQPLTLTHSKPMIPVANKPMLEWTLAALRDFVEDVVVVVNEQQQDIIEYFKDSVTFVYQDAPLGTANALAAAEPYIHDEFVMANCDDFFSREDIKRFIRQKKYSIATFPSDTPQNFGVVECDGSLVKNIIEKPQNPQSDLVNAGLYLLDKNIFDYIRQLAPSPRGEYEITDAFRMLINDTEMHAYVLGKWVTASYPWDILDVNKLILDEFGTQIANDVDIRSGAHIEYPCAIGSGSVIGPNCFVRRYSSIGKNCKVGQAVEIKNSIVMDNTFVSHLSYVGDSIIGSNCNIAAGTKFANLRLDEKNVKMNINGRRVDSGHRKLGALVGDDVKFGVNVTVMPGKRIWPNILVPPCSTIKDDLMEQPNLREEPKKDYTDEEE
jgi:UDP-N-acetylglucosamine diphosphorylase / glucose-1-phosphate thymidylyltransferase / UDP-N-acetylgalactosamine diphosphorylase / glucosamine-1-phosphate N-acetyltransferase / galactosamine-1-phosphate N-acetyltransferase